MSGKARTAPPVVTRRTVLVGLGVAALPGLAGLSGCSTPDGAAPGPTPDPSGTAAPDDVLRAEAYGQELALAERYTAARASYPKLREVLAVGDRHRLYAAALAGDASPTASPGATRAPAKRTVLAELGRAESEAAEQRLAQCRRAADPELARLLALIGAGCAAAAAQLGGSRG